MIDDDLLKELHVVKPHEAGRFARANHVDSIGFSISSGSNMSNVNSDRMANLCGVLATALLSPASSSQSIIDRESSSF